MTTRRRRLPLCFLVAALVLAACQDAQSGQTGGGTEPDSPGTDEVVDDDAEDGGEDPGDDGDTGGEPTAAVTTRDEVTVNTSFNFGATFAGQPPPDSGDLGPLAIVAQHKVAPSRTEVSITNNGSEPVAAVVLTDLVNLVAVPLAAGGTEASPAATAEPASIPEVTHSVTQGTCSDQGAGTETVTLTCELGDLEPGASLLLTVAFSARVRVSHTIAVSAVLP